MFLRLLHKAEREGMLSNSGYDVSFTLRSKPAKYITKKKTMAMNTGTSVLLQILAD